MEINKEKEASNYALKELGEDQFINNNEAREAIKTYFLDGFNRAMDVIREINRENAEKAIKFDLLKERAEQIYEQNKSGNERNAWLIIGEDTAFIFGLSNE